MHKIGRYEVIRELGKGGMAIVYLARDPAMDRQVAVKVLPRQFTFDPQFRARFHREAKAIAALEHPAIVPVYDYGEHEEQPYIVMRYMTGGSLADRMQKGRLSLAEVAELFNRIAPALDIAHQRGMIHRDLKPGNILYDEWGGAYLSDFGIVKITEATAAFTASGIIGTPAYMSPEQAVGKSDLDGRSDVYSLGVVLFELLSGQLPFTADTPMGLAVAHINEPIPDILSIDRTLPPNTENVIRRALAKKREDRYPTASSLRNEIAELATPASPQRTAPAGQTRASGGAGAGNMLYETARSAVGMPPAAPVRRLTRWVWAMIAVLGLGAVVGLAAVGSGLLAAVAFRPTSTELSIAAAGSTVTPSLMPTAAPTSTPPPTSVPATSTPTLTVTLASPTATLTHPPPTKTKASVVASATPTPTDTPALVSQGPRIHVISAELHPGAASEQYYLFSWEIIPKTEWPLCPGRTYAEWFASPKKAYIEIRETGRLGAVAWDAPRELGPSTGAGSDQTIFSYKLTRNLVVSEPGATYYFVVTHYGGCDLKTPIANEWIPFVWP